MQTARSPSIGQTRSPAVVPILLVEDDDNARMALRIALRHGGFDVISSPDAVDALNAIKVRPDLAAAIIDVRLPRTDGFTLGRMLRERSPQLRFLYYTSHYPIHEVDTGEALGQLIERPSDPGVLIRAVKNLLEPSQDPGDGSAGSR
jgi:DNA-binding NtrC family response regulator